MANFFQTRDAASPSQKEKPQNLKIIIIFILLICVFYCDKLIVGPYATIRIHDTFDTEFSRYASTGKLFLKNGFFAWNPNIICGMPAYAFHFPPHYILCLFSLVLPVWFIYTALVMLLMFIAGYGMYWFLKDYLGVGSRLSLLGGLLFSLQTQIHSNSIVHVVFNYSFAMFFMCLIVLSRQDISFRSRVFSLVFIILTLFFSYPVLTLPIFFILQCLVLAFLSFDKRLSIRKTLFKTGLIWGGYILLSAPVLYGLYKFAPFSQRTYGDYADIQVFLTAFTKNLLQLFLQYLTDSSLFLLAAGSIPLIFYSRKARRVFLVLLAALLITTFFQRPFLSAIRGSIFEKMDLGHFSWTLPFLITIFVIVGIEELLRIRAARKLCVFSFLAAMLILIYFMRAAIGFTPGTLLNITVPLFIFLFCLLLNAGAGKKKILAAAVILSIIILGQFKITRLLKFENYPYARFYDSQPVFDNLRKEAENEPFRVVTTLSFPMVMQSYGLETIETRSPIMPRSYKEFFREVIKPQLQTEKQIEQFDTYWYNLYLRDAAVTPFTKNKETSRGLFNPALLLMANTKYIISRYRDPYLESISEKVIEAKSSNLTRPSLLKKVFMAGEGYLNKPFFKKLIPAKIANVVEDSLFKKIYCPDYFVYQLTDYFPRGYLVDNAVLFESDKEVLNELSLQTIESLKSKVFFLKKNVVIDEIPCKKQVPLVKDDRVNLVSYSPDKLLFKVTLISPKILVVTNNYHPGWKAVVNGKEEKIYRANHTFQAVFLEKTGSYDVSLSYRDPLLWKMRWLAFFGLLLVVCAGIGKSGNIALLTKNK